MNLMETGLWLFLIVNLTLELCNTLLLQRRPNISLFSILIATLILTRPESIVYGPFFIVLLFLVQQISTIPTGKSDGLIYHPLPAIASRG